MKLQREEIYKYERAWDEWKSDLFKNTGVSVSSSLFSFTTWMSTTGEGREFLLLLNQDIIERDKVKNK